MNATPEQIEAWKARKKAGATLQQQVHQQLVDQGMAQQRTIAVAPSERPAQTDRERLVVWRADDVKALETERPWQGSLEKKPWHYQVTAVIPHRNTPEHLELCIQFLQQQTERPYIMIIDTGSDDSTLTRVLALRSDSVEVHQVACHATQEYADVVCYAMDLAMSACRSEYLWCLHCDCFVINRQLLAELLAKADGGKNPVIGYESVSANKHPECQGMVSHTCTLLHMPTMDQLDICWSTRRLQQQMHSAGREIIPDVEMALNHRLRDRNITPLLLGPEQPNGIERDANRVHLRSGTLGTQALANRSAHDSKIETAMDELKIMLQRSSREPQILDTASLPSREPRVSIIVTARNYGHFLREALESCVSQKVPCEIIYSDDASNDDSLTIANAFGDQVRVIACPYHSGAVESRNRGADAAKGDVFVFLDGDDVLPPDFVEQKLASLRPDSPFAYGSIREFGEGNRFYKAPNWGEIDLRQANFCETASAVWKWAFEEAGRWRETAGTLWDWHLWLRASQLGEPARSESVLLYRVHSKSASRTVGFARADANFNELRRRMLDDVSAHLEAARRPLRVGLLWYAINLGGGDQVALNLIGGRPRGIEWSGLALMDIGSSKREMLEEAARHTYLAGCGDFCIPGTARFDHSRDAARFVASQSDVLITWGVDQIDEVLGEFKGKLIVLSQCSNWLPTARVNSAAPYDALFVAVSEAAAVPLYKAGAHRSRVHVIHNGSSARFTDPAQSREHVRRSLGLEPESIAVGFVGRICEEKNPLDVARAVSILKAPYRAVFVGEGPLAETIRREFPIAIVVDPTPYVGDVFNALDCFVLVSHAEGMSLSVIEAWLCATPVVATYVGAIPELEREHGAMAVTVDAGAQPSEIAEAIKMAISPHNRSKVEYARRVAVEKYSTEEMRNRWEKFLRPLKQRGV